MELNKVQLKDGRWIEQYVRDACDRCILKDGGSCQHSEHPELHGIDCSSRQWRLCEPKLDTGERLTPDGKYIRFPKRGCPGCCFSNAAGVGCNKPSEYLWCCSTSTDESYQFRPVSKSIPETPKKKVYPKPEDCVKVPCETCDGCVFGNLKTPEDCHHPNRDASGGSACGSFSNPTSMIYVLKSSAEAKVSSWDNGIHYMVAMSGCSGCCFNAHCSKLKPDSYPECITGEPLGVSSQFRAHENPCSEITKPEFEDEEIEEDPENLDMEFDLKEGGVVRGVRERNENGCGGCYFSNGCGDCSRDDLIDDDDDASCEGIIFECIEDPPTIYPEDDDYLPEDDQTPVGGTITVDGNVYVSTKDSYGPGSVTSCEACDLDGDNCPGALERCMHNTHFKLVVGLNPPDSKPIVGELIFRKETKYSL